MPRWHNNLQHPFLTQRFRKTTEFQWETVREGNISVRVGDEMKRFVMRAKYLNHPIFEKLLNNWARQYSYDHEGGALRIPCDVGVFQRILEALRLGQDTTQLLIEAGGNSSIQEPEIFLD